jgi:hypothetical protein
MHRSFHLVAFAITALLFRRCIAGHEFFGTGASSIRASLQAVLATIATGLVIETLQHLMYHIPMEWWDVRDDSIAAIGVAFLGHAAGAVLRPRNRGHSRENNRLNRT